jgi:3-oxoacyl-[acyl-carrier-protein] synthase III
MSELQQEQKQEHSPTLNTVLMVESALKSMDESVITLADLKRKLPRQVNHNTLKVILEYLELSNKILVTMRGITWIHNPNPNLRRAIAEGLEL